MVIIAKPVVEFSSRGTKLERFLHKNQHTRALTQTTEYFREKLCLKTQNQIRATT